MIINNPSKIFSSNNLKIRVAKYNSDPNYWDLTLNEDIDFHNKKYKDNIHNIGMKSPTGLIYYMDIVYK